MTMFAMTKGAMLGGVVLLAASAGTGTARANVCQTDKLMCATTMPVGGFCECTKRGMSEDGTVLARAPSGARINATAGGCGAHPGAPGCR